MNKKLLQLMAICALTGLVGACGGDDPNPGVDSGVDTGVDASDGEVDGGPEPETGACGEPLNFDLPCPTGTITAPSEPACPLYANRTVVQVTGAINADTTWTCDNIYKLNGYVYVGNGANTTATLSIGPGTIIEGNLAGVGTTGGALVVTRGSRLRAIGTATNPIVFTSAAAVRAPGQWGGIQLFGRAPTNQGDNVLFEGLTDAPLHRYGGTDEAWDCGTLKYVRVEFAGYTFAANKEFNGITLAGCGYETRLSYVQTHRGSDDGIEHFGGSAHMDHIVISGSDDDGLDWDFGWRGRAQNVIIHSWSSSGDSGIEADNNEPGATGVLPRSQPTIYNMSIIGPGGADRGMTLRKSTFFNLRNLVVQGWQDGVDLVPLSDADACYAQHWPSEMFIENSYFFGNTNNPGPAGNATLMDTALVTNAARNNATATDPQITVGSNNDPNYVPAAASLPGATPPSTCFFDATATYAGAVAPSATGPAIWYAGWTSFPSN